MDLLNLEEFSNLTSVTNYDLGRNFYRTFNESSCPTFVSGDTTYNLCPLIGLLFVLFFVRIFTLIGFDGLSGPSTGYDAPSTSYGSPPSSYDAPSTGYGSPAPSYDAPAPSYSSPASTYGLRNQDLYYLYPEAFQNVDENFGNVDLTQTQNDYLTRLLSSNTGATGQGNNGATSQGNIAYQGNGIAGVNVQYPSYNPYLANYQLQQNQQLQQHQAKRK